MKKPTKIDNYLDVFCRFQQTLTHLPETRAQETEKAYEQLSGLFATIARYSAECFELMRRVPLRADSDGAALTLCQWLADRARLHDATMEALHAAYLADPRAGGILESLLAEGGARSVICRLPAAQRHDVLLMLVFVSQFYEEMRSVVYEVCKAKSIYNFQELYEGYMERSATSAGREALTASLLFQDAPEEPWWALERAETRKRGRPRQESPMEADEICLVMSHISTHGMPLLESGNLGLNVSRAARFLTELFGFSVSFFTKAINKIVNMKAGEFERKKDEVLRPLREKKYFEEKGE